MAQELPDLLERGASAQQIGRERVTQQVSPFELWVQPGSLESATNDAADGDGAGKAAPWTQPIFPDRIPPKRLSGPDVVDQMTRIIFGPHNAER